MLKLERRQQNITVALQRQERVCSRTLLTAFAIASLLHLAAFILIRVTPIITGGKEIILAPITVNAQIPVGAEVSIDFKTEIYPFEPPEPRPLFPDLPCRLPALSSVTLVAFQEPGYPFKHTPLPDLGCKEKPHPFRLTVSGPLAAARLIQPKLPKIEGNIQEKYAVRVDNRTGRIFWYQAESNKPHPELEALFDSLYFITLSDTPFTSGMIEMGARL